MAKAVLHIGTPKTGTTYLQLALNANRAQLAEEDWSILDAGSIELEASGHAGLSAGLTICHHQLAWSLQGERPLPFGVANVPLEDLSHNAEIEFRRGGNFVISSECFYWEVRDINTIRILKDIFPADTTVVVWLRNRWKFIDSMFAQAVYDHGSDQTVMEYVTENLPFFDYGAALSQWSTVFGPENIIVKYYDSTRNSFMSFAETLGVKTSALSFPAERLNLSVPKFLIPVLQRAGLDRARHLHLSDSAKYLCTNSADTRMLSFDEVAKIAKVCRSGDFFLQQFGASVGLIGDPISYLQQGYVYETRLDQIAGELGLLLTAVM